jgi:hypothetical protein
LLIIPTKTRGKRVATSAKANGEEKMRDIPGFETLKVFKHGRLWYIIDCTEGCGDPYKDSIGGHFTGYGDACSFAQVNYARDYH